MHADQSKANEVWCKAVEEARVLEGLGSRPSSSLCVGVTCRSDGIDVFNLLAVLVYNHTATALGSWDAVSGSTEVENLFVKSVNMFLVYTPSGVSSLPRCM